VAPLQAKTSGARRQPNSEAMADDEFERTESGSADKESEHPADEHEGLESENELQESSHGRNAPDDQDDGNGCICRVHGVLTWWPRSRHRKHLRRAQRLKARLRSRPSFQCKADGPR
jgi:hypothetical protein